MNIKMQHKRKKLKDQQNPEQHPDLLHQIIQNFVLKVRLVFQNEITDWIFVDSLYNLL